MSVLLYKQMKDISGSQMENQRWSLGYKVFHYHTLLHIKMSMHFTLALFKIVELDL